MLVIAPWRARPPSRFALVIGNSAYTKVKPLPNAVNDARLIAKRLEDLGIEVHLHEDLDKVRMVRAKDAFVARLKQIGKADTAIFYFSGHGFQDRETNYLLPIVTGEAETDPMKLQDLLTEVTAYSNRRLVFLDACRSYFEAEPVETELALARGLSLQERPTLRRGLADFETAEDTFISFSAAPGKIAFDGVEGRTNSPYAEALARFTHEVDLPLTVMMARVRNSVLDDTKDIRIDGKPEAQKTWDSSSLKASFFFNPSSLLFLFGNSLALFASFIALVSLGVVNYEVSVADFAGLENRIHWALISLAALGVTIAIFLFGVGRAYARVRGEEPEWQRAGEFKLFKWSSVGSFGAVGGVLGGIIAHPIVMLPYWRAWRTSAVDERVLDAMCAERHWADPSLPEICPRLGQLFAEGSLVGIFILTVFGFLAMHCCEWMTRGRPAMFFGARRPVLLIAGTMFGGVLAGIFVGPFITAYFGSFDRPFLEPDFVIAPSIIAVALMAFCVVNYNLETFTPARLARSFLGALAGTVCAGVVLGAIVGLLYLVGFIQAVFSWANEGFYDYEGLGTPAHIRYGYLIIAGVPYGMVFGLAFGVLIGTTRLVTERVANSAFKP